MYYSSIELCQLRRGVPPAQSEWKMDTFRAFIRTRASNTSHDRYEYKHRVDHAQDVCCTLRVIRRAPTIRGNCTQVAWGLAVCFGRALHYVTDAD